MTGEHRISVVRIGLASPESIRARRGHVELAIPVPHPWFLADDESPIVSLLDLPRATIERGDRAGVAAIYDLLRRLDLDRLAPELREQILLTGDDPEVRGRLIRRLRLVETLRRAGACPEWLMLTALPVLPADLRPPRTSGEESFADEGAAAPDLNDQYARVIECNKRLRELIEAVAPDVELAGAERDLRTAVGDVVAALTARLSGPTGRIRHDLLSKRVDFSGRSVVVPAPELELDQCGLPMRMALELFKPHVAGRLLAAGRADRLEDAIRLVERAAPEAVAVLEDLLLDQVVLVSHASARGQPMVRAFEPLVLDGNAIRVHPLVTAAFDQDQDRRDDEVTVHVVLSEAARREARARLLPSRTVLDPANGEPSIVPSGDMVLGCYLLTTEMPGATGEGTRLADIDEARRYFDLGLIDLGARISVRLGDLPIHSPWHWRPVPPPAERPVLTDTTVGRLIFHEAIESVLRQFGHPPMPFRNQRIDKGGLREIVTIICREYGQRAATAVLEAITRLGHHYATRSGTSLGIDDFAVPPEKQRLVAEADAEVAELHQRFGRGLISDEERHDDAIAIWTRTKEFVTNAMDKALDPFGPITMLAQSGTRGYILQISQVSGMRGLVVLPSGLIAELPIRASFGEGLSPHEYFLGTFGVWQARVREQTREARAVDLARRLVAAAQDVRVTEEDCATDADWPPGIWIEGLTERRFLTGKQPSHHDQLDQLVGRHLAGDVVYDLTGEVLFVAGTLLGEAERDRIARHQVARVYVRSPMTCQSRGGVCRRCYGWDRARRDSVEIGAAVGLVAARSIAADADRLTMRIFHLGMPRRDVLQRQDEQIRTGAIRVGLPGIDALLEVREPRDAAILSDIAGVVEVQHRADARWIGVTDPESEYDQHEYRVPTGSRLRVVEGQTVAAGEQLTDGERRLEDVLRLFGRAGAQRFLVDELRWLHRSQGIVVDHRHFEVIVRQMLRFGRVVDSGDTDWLPGDLVDRVAFDEEQRRIEAGGVWPATAEPVVLGISEVAANVGGFLAAAIVSDDLPNVLGKAALAGTVDRLHGLSAQTIVGRPIAH